MGVTVPSFAKINLGLRIGPRRADGFHELRTVYQTIAVHDVINVSIGRGLGVEIRCDNPRVPCDSSNTCWKIAERVMEALKARGRVVIEIEKKLPVQGGLGGASGNAVSTMLALERVLKKRMPASERLRIAAEVGSDLPLFLIGGTVLGVGRGEEVYPLPDLPVMPCVVVLSEIAVSTPQAFAEWDRLCGADTPVREVNPAVQMRVGGVLRGQGTASSAARMTSRERVDLAKEEQQVPRLGNHSQTNDSASLGMTSRKSGSPRGMTSPLEKPTDDESEPSKLTSVAPSDRMFVSGREISAWLAAGFGNGERRRSGVSARGGGRAENLLLDLVRTGIENDFERVVFPQYPELREVKRVLENAGAAYASLSGSGSAVYGLFASKAQAETAARKLAKGGTQAVVTSTLTRLQYWKKLWAVSS
jgi:4-diphosphocytidyl-2-C-methyl-D-erythritol kinase